MSTPSQPEPARGSAAEPERDAATKPRVSVRRVSSDDEPVLPNRSADDSDVGWGDDPRESRDDWYRQQRPPHWE